SGRHRAGRKDLSHGRRRDAAGDDAGRDRAHHPRRRPRPGRARHAVQRAGRGGRAGAAEAVPPRRAAQPGGGAVMSGKTGESKIPLRAVSFLNARPITYGLEHGIGRDARYDRFELSFDLPSRCAEALRAGETDLALMPSASYADMDAALDLRAVPGI